MAIDSAWPPSSCPHKNWCRENGCNLDCSSEQGNEPNRTPFQQQVMVSLHMIAGAVLARTEPSLA